MNIHDIPQLLLQLKSKVSIDREEQGISKALYCQYKSNFNGGKEMLTAGYRHLGGGN